MGRHLATAAVGVFSSVEDPQHNVLGSHSYGQDYAEVSLGWEVGYGANANLFIDWNGRFGEDLIENSLALGVRAAW